MNQTYLTIMIQSLNKKIEVLDKIIDLNLIQKQQLESLETPVEEFDNTVEEKAKLIKQLEQLDSGFDKLYERVRMEILMNKEIYTSEILTMQKCIGKITDKSVEIQTQEARNKDLMTQKFTYVKEKAKFVRANNKAVNQYYKNMMQLNYVEPQFMDNKK